ncbi:hypothetical protein [Pseudomonas sp. LPB4.O]|uniref:hypothetical protein n=1 Tax=Pseudomonas sp. LPB4.O TaxID=3135254 RepID=UPI0031332005
MDQHVNPAPLRDNRIHHLFSLGTVTDIAAGRHGLAAGGANFCHHRIGRASITTVLAAPIHTIVINHDQSPAFSE